MIVFDPFYLIPNTFQREENHVRLSKCKRIGNLLL